MFGRLVRRRSVAAARGGATNSGWQSSASASAMTSARLASPGSRAPAEKDWIPVVSEQPDTALADGAPAADATLLEAEDGVPAGHALAARR